jgi:hypothetical protein
MIIDWSPPTSKKNPILAPRRKAKKAIAFPALPDETQYRSVHLSDFYAR